MFVKFSEHHGWSQTWFLGIVPGNFFFIYGGQNFEIYKQAFTDIEY